MANRAPRILVLGDAILDRYLYGHTTRICPEGPFPIIVVDRTVETGGGACLVVNQMDALIGGDNIWSVYGSHSTKTRLFADGHMAGPRLDNDSTRVDTPDQVIERFCQIMNAQQPDLVVVSDYGKGALTEESAKRIMDSTLAPILVDAKNNFEWYAGVFAQFPNEKEYVPSMYITNLSGHVIRKLGSRGCLVDRVYVPLMEVHDMRDTTGAGDCFLAAFAAKFATDLVAGYKPEEVNLISCAKYANHVAARSVEFVGTHIVTDVPLETRI